MFVLRVAMFQLFGVLLWSASASRYGPKLPTERQRRDERRDLQTSVGVVDEFILINTGSDRAILTIQNGTTINIETVGTFRFNVQTTVIGNVRSIKYGHNSKPQFSIENGETFAFCGHEGTNFYRCEALNVGLHTITATPYSENNLGGDEGSPRQVTFSIINETEAQNRCSIPKIIPDWERIPPEYPLDAAETQAAILGNSLFITGGFTTSFRNVTTQSFARDISVANSSWRQMDDMPVPIGITHASVVAIGMKLYMCGGYEGIRPGHHVPNCFIYDHAKAPGNGQWSTFTNLPNGGSAGGGMIYDSVTRMLYYSGGGQRRTPDSLETTDITNTWKISIDAPSTGWIRSTPFPYKANHLSAVTTKDLLGQEQHFFAGGQLGENEVSGNVDDMYEFVPTTETWIRRASLPSARSHTTVSTRAIGCGFIMAGGTLNSETTRKNRTSEILYYDVPTNRWTTIGDVPIPGATPPVFIDDKNFIYYVNNRRTSRSKITL